MDDSIPVADLMLAGIALAFIPLLAIALVERGT